MEAEGADVVPLPKWSREVQSSVPVLLTTAVPSKVSKAISAVSPTVFATKPHLRRDDFFSNNHQ